MIKEQISKSLKTFQNPVSTQKQIQSGADALIYRPEFEERKLGKWNHQQEQIFLRFMISNKDKFRTKNSKRRNKIFKKLSQVIGGKRTAEQCRMHYCQLQIWSKKRGVEAILNYFTNMPRFDHLNSGQKSFKSNLSLEKNSIRDLKSLTTEETPHYFVEQNKLKKLEIILTLNLNMLNVW